ncbi:MAG: hypothetical protein MZV63_16730 [Marinilabiliales bacterium]|nr:hypothetical protein [Marinilabiliales bacterium]
MPIVHGPSARSRPLSPGDGAGVDGGMATCRKNTPGPSVDDPDPRSRDGQPAHRAARPRTERAFMRPIDRGVTHGPSRFVRRRR